MVLFLHLDPKSNTRLVISQQKLPPAANSIDLSLRGIFVSGLRLTLYSQAAIAGLEQEKTNQNIDGTSRYSSSRKLRTKTFSCPLQCPLECSNVRALGQADRPGLAFGLGLFETTRLGVFEEKLPKLSEV